MATRSYIGKQASNGTITAVYCHWDGYPSGVGAILNSHYRDEQRLDALLAMGSMSVLGPEFGDKHAFSHYDERYCTFHRRDGGRDDWDANELADEATFLGYADSFDAEWAYLWIAGEWYGYRIRGCGPGPRTPIAEMLALYP